MYENRTPPKMSSDPHSLSPSKSSDAFNMRGMQITVLLSFDVFMYCWIRRQNPLHCWSCIVSRVIVLCPPVFASIPLFLFMGERRWMPTMIRTQNPNYPWFKGFFILCLDNSCSELIPPGAWKIFYWLVIGWSHFKVWETSNWKA